MTTLRYAALFVCGWALLLLVPERAAPWQPPARAADQEDAHIFHLRNASAIDASRVLREIFAKELGPKGVLRLSVDERTNSLIVAGEAAKVMRVAALLQRLDTGDAARPEKKAEASGDLQVRVYWLAHNPDRKESPGLAGDLRDVAAELGRLGLDRIRLVSQVTVSPGARFEMSGVAHLDQPYRLTAAGTAVDKKSAVGLDLVVSVAQVPPPRDPRPVADLRTRLTVPLGRSVVAGIVPSEAAASAFVVRVTRAGAADTGPARKTTMEFRNVPWKQVLTWLSDQTGLPVVASNTPTGTFTFQPPAGREYTVPEILDVVNEALANQKYLLIRRPNSLVLVPADERLDPALAPRVRADELAGRGKSEWLALSIPLRGVQAEAIASDVRKLLGPFGDVQVLKSANRLEVRDTAEYLRRVAGLIAEVETPKGK